MNPNSYVTTNINGTLNILEACRINNKRLIHTSTSEIYGNAKKFPISEEEMPLSQSPYAATKIAGDQLALSYFKSFNLPVKLLDHLIPFVQGNQQEQSFQLLFLKPKKR